MPNKTTALLAAAFLAVAAHGETVSLKPGMVEVVAEARACPTVRFAACEMTNWLARVLGAPVPLVAEPSTGTVVSVVLGDSAWSRADGIDVSRLGQDAYVTRVAPGRVYIAGRDDPRASPSAVLSSGGSYALLMRHDKATLFGVYGFLEGEAGVRFYLPDDELGVIARRRDCIDLAVGEKVAEPSFLIREPYMGGDGSWYCERDAKDRSRIKALEWLRLRMSVRAIPCCHGSRRFRYIERFGKTHPEYLALKPDGTRRMDPDGFAAYQLCWTNPGLQETMYQDVKAYLTGLPASSRGLKSWGNNCKDGRYVDIMPDDAFQPCQCADCQAAYARKGEDPNYATEHIWGTVAKFGRRLIEEGVEGNIAMMSYRPYGRIPDIDLPTNVLVMVAKRGPWGLVNPEKSAEDDAQIRAWTEKLGHKVWIWTYPHKFSGTAIKGVPCMAPHAWGRYFRQVSPWIFGTFAESESDKAIYNHLNYYVFSRIAWDADADVDAIVREYHELMFGAGSDDMARAYGLLERKWLEEVAGRSEDTPLGPVAKAPSAYQLWREVYSPEVRRELQDLFRAAESKVAPGSPEHRRIGLMRREILKPLLDEAEAYERATDVKSALERRSRGPNRSVIPPLGAKGFWGGKFNLDTNDFVTAPGSVHFSSTHTSSVRIGLYGHDGYPDLKPNTKYRLSYFVKTRDVLPIPIPGGTAGGVSVNIWDDRNHWFPSANSTPRGNVFTGTMDWTYQEFEFVTGPLTNNRDPEKGKVNRSYLQLHILYASGEAWFDDVRLEEVPEDPLPCASADVTFTSGNAEVVIGKDAPPVVKFAAEEATNFLSRVLGSPVPVVHEQTPGRTALVLGGGPLAEAAGLDPSDKPQDSFFVKAAGNAVYVVGRDDPKKNPRSVPPWSLERGTLHGLYAFLEDYAGCRFYFPGELGEVVPRRGSFSVPEGERMVKPDYLIRRYMNTGKWFDDVPEKRSDWLKNLNCFRIRASSTSIPCCHGTIKMGFSDKYEHTHPEYFALNSNGERHTRSTLTGRDPHGSLCYSSDVRDRVYEYCVEQFSNGAKYVDIMPNDAMPECSCEKCQRLIRRTPGFGGKSFDSTDVVWGYTKYVGEKLIENKVPGFVTQMAYASYRRIPDFELPTNILVMVAQGGPWSMATPELRDAQHSSIRAWAKKVGHPVWIWTYPHKFWSLNIPGLPDFAPRAWGGYYKPLAKDIIGAFAESETDLWIYHYLNYYVFERVCWDTDADVDALLDEHYRLMFGGAAPEMKAVFEGLEDKWVGSIAGKVRTTAVGPAFSPPSETEIWTEIYGPAEIAAIAARFDAAAKAVPAGSIEARRVEFFRRNYLGPLEDGAMKYAERRAAVEGLVWRAKDGVPIELRPFKPSRKKAPEEFVKTLVSVERTDAELVVKFECEDNRMDDLLAVPRPHDDKDIWRDAGVEIVLNPNADRKTFYHFMVNAEGSVADSKGVCNGSKEKSDDWSWDSGAKATVERHADGWSMAVAIPLSDLGDLKDSFPAEFVRNRVTKSGSGYCRYNWSPYVFGFTSIGEFGTIDLSR